MITLILVVLGAIAVVLGLVYAVVGLSNAGFFFTVVEEGWSKIKLTWGSNPLVLGPGLHLLGLPGIHTLYRRKMTFLKVLLKEDGTVAVKSHDDPNVANFKTTAYPYAVPFKDEEDSHGLPLSGVMSINGRMVNAIKMFFGASDWYSTIFMLSTARLRVVITTVSFEEITGQEAGQATGKKAAKKVLAQLLWEEMNTPREGGKLSVVAELLQTYGFEVESVELASIDPPPGWRATTLAPYQAQKEKEAAVHQAETSAILFNDTNQALKTWTESHPKATRIQIAAKQDELSSRALAKTGSYRKFRVEGLENATTAVVGDSGNAGLLVGGGGKDKGGRGGGGRRKPTEMSDDEAVEASSRGR